MFGVLRGTTQIAISLQAIIFLAAPQPVSQALPACQGFYSWPSAAIFPTSTCRRPPS